MAIPRALTAAPKPRNLMFLFKIRTSQKSNTIKGQHFEECTGTDAYGEIHDDFTPGDVPTAFKRFPSNRHLGRPLTVNQFIRMY
jgi:hypothetical protein